MGGDPCGPHPPFRGGVIPLGLHPLVAAANRCQTHMSTMETSKAKAEQLKVFFQLAAFLLYRLHPPKIISAMGDLDQSINPLGGGIIHNEINTLLTKNKKDEHIQDQKHPFTDQAKNDRSLRTREYTMISPKQTLS